MAIEQTLVFIKPEGLRKNLTGNIISRISETKADLVAAKIIRVSRELALVHYAHLKDNPKIYEGTIRYIMGELHDEGRVDRKDRFEHYRRKVFAFVYYGTEAVSRVRELCGGTNPEKADPTSIRGSYGRITTDGVFENVIHSSENLTEAKKEIKMWFKPEELLTRSDESLTGYETEKPGCNYLLLGAELDRIGMSFSYDGKTTYFAIDGKLYLTDGQSVSIFQNVSIEKGLKLSKLEEAVDQNKNKPQSECGRVIITPNMLLWKSDLRALEDIYRNPKEAKIQLDAVLAKYMVHSEPFEPIN